MNRNSAYNLLLSFVLAFGGILHALRWERNLRIHFAAAGYLLYFSRYYDLSPERRAILLLAIGFVITCELFNTAIENTVDSNTPAFNPFAKVAKDVAAGAVLVSALTSVGVGYVFFWDPPTLHAIFEDILAHPVAWALAAAATLVWIFLPQAKRSPITRPETDRPTETEKP